MSQTSEDSPRIEATLIRRCLRLPEIRSGEELLVFWALALTACHSLTYTYLTTVSQSLFLAVFDAKDLPLIQLGGAAAVMLLGFFKPGPGSWFGPIRGMLGLTAMFAAMVLLSRILLQEGASAGPAIFLAVGSVAFFIFSNMMLWGVLDLCFNAEQAARLFGLIAAVECLAEALAGGLTPWLVESLGSVNLLYIAAAGLAGSFAATKGIGVFAREAGVQEQAAQSPEADDPARFRKYVVLLHVVWGVSYMVYFLTDTAFSSAVELRFHDTLDQMTSFLGLFYGVAGFFELILAGICFNRILGRLGIIGALSLLPAGLALFCLASSGAGLILPGDVTFFFGLITALKLFDYIMRYAVNDPAYQVLYLALPPRLRFKTQSSVTVLAEPLAVALAGATTLLGGLFFSINARNMIGLALVFVLLQCWMTGRLGKLYKQL